MQFIITLTSYLDRLERTTPIALQSILEQSEKPDRIVLWLSYGTEITSSLMDFKNRGIQIEFCEDQRSYTKLIPALLKFPDDVLITVDDDVYYPTDWFKNLKSSYFRNPSAIQVNRAHEIKIANTGELGLYKDWKYCVTQFQNERCIFPTGVGGILYPPKTLHPEVFNSDVFLSIAPKGDDIWFWAMAIMQGSKYYVLENGYSDIQNIDENDTGMWIENIHFGGNDIQMISVLEQYPFLISYLEEAIPDDVIE